MRTAISSSPKFEVFQQAYQEFLAAPSFTRQQKALRLIDQIDQMSQEKKGMQLLTGLVQELEMAGIFADTPWADPSRLVPALVKGTLKAGHPTSTYELLSELRLLTYATGQNDLKTVRPQDARNFLDEVIVNNLEFVLRDLTEESRERMSDWEINKIYHLFEYLVDHAEMKSIKTKLANEIRLVCAQRPVVTRKTKALIHMVKKKMSLTGNRAEDQELQYFVDCLYRPTRSIRNNTTLRSYALNLRRRTHLQRLTDAQEMGARMRNTGLVSHYHLAMFKFAIEKDKDDLVHALLGLNPTGVAEWNAHRDFIVRLVEPLLEIEKVQFLYGLSRMLERGLFSRRVVRSSLDNFSRIELHPIVEEKILRSIVHYNRARPRLSARDYLMGALLRILGQPLGVGQGNNPTCQSARGISLWSEHAPAKLIRLLSTAATQNNLIFRFEDKFLESTKLNPGLVEQLDYDLDAVSVVLVPHLDKIYNEMMRRAAGRGEDPHKWANPAMYGQWVPVGFASAYHYISGTIMDFEGFLRIFFAAFHMEYNGMLRMMYPNPVGIFITSAQGQMVGFHAVSLLRVEECPNGEMRAYFLNPNNEGRQDWGQGIRPTVSGNGERYGESSLPFDQFAARVYAFHYNPLEVDQWIESVPQEAIDQVYRMAESSWGQSYIWSKIKRQW